MTLWEIANEIEERQYRTGAPVSRRDAICQAASEVTEGFRYDKPRTKLDLGLAAACAVLMEETGNVSFTAYGYQYDAGALRRAIGIMRLTPEVQGLVPCLYHPFRLAVNEINFVMVCDDCRESVRARKLAEGPCSSFRHEAGFVRIVEYPYVQEVM